MAAGVGDQAIDRAPRRQAAVDVIAEKNIHASRHRPQRTIGADVSQQLLEQIETAVNISDRVDPQVRWQLWASPAHGKILSARQKPRHPSPFPDHETFLATESQLFPYFGLENAGNRPHLDVCNVIINTVKVPGSCYAMVAGSAPVI